MDDPLRRRLLVTATVILGVFYILVPTRLADDPGIILNHSEATDIDPVVSG